LRRIVNVLKGSYALELLVALVAKTVGCSFNDVNSAILVEGCLLFLSCWLVQVYNAVEVIVNLRHWVVEQTRRRTRLVILSPVAESSSVTLRDFPPASSA
jgi:hypothetical protein